MSRFTGPAVAHRVYLLSNRLGPLAIPQKKKITKTRKAKESRLTEADKIKATEVRGS